MYIINNLITRIKNKEMRKCLAVKFRIQKSEFLTEFLRKLTLFTSLYVYCR